MSVFQRPPEKGSRTPLRDCLAHGRRRRVLRTLAERGETVTERQLATEVASDASGGTPDPTTVQRLHIALRHIDLAKLADAGLVTWDEADATVAPTDHPLVGEPAFEALLAADDDRRVEVLLDDGCRDLLSVLAGRSGPMARSELARTVAARESGGVPEGEAVKELQIRLHHVYLPTLSEAGLVEYDADAGTVTARVPADLPDLAALAALDGPSPSRDEGTQEIKIP